MSGAKTLDVLMAGNRRYREGESLQRDFRPRVEELVGGQKPSAIIVTCADSRVPPEHIFDCGLGEVFVIRNAGNVLTDEAIASIEYAQANLGSNLCLIMGHTSCGAIDAALNTLGNPDAAPTPHLAKLVRHIHPAIESESANGTEKKPRAEVMKAAAQANATYGVEQLGKKSELLANAIREGRLTAYAGVYDLASGEVLVDGEDQS